MTLFRYLSRSVAATLVIEGLAGLALGVWIIVSYAGLADTTAEIFEVEAPAWAAAAGAQMALTLVLPSAALVAAGRRWWVSEQAFGAGRRLWIYLVLTAHLLALLGGVIEGSVEAIAIGIAGGLLSLGTLAVGVLRCVEEIDAPKRAIPWVKVAVAGMATVAVASAGAGLGAILTSDDSESLFSSIYPTNWVVCRGPVDEACAAEAAKRAGHPVAWLPEDGDREGRGFVAITKPDVPAAPRGGRVFQELRDGWIYISVYSEPAPATGALRLVRRVKERGIAADIYIEKNRSAIEWTHRDTRYRIEAFRMLDDEDSLIRAARRALADIRYASP